VSLSWPGALLLAAVGAALAGLVSRTAERLEGDRRGWAPTGRLRPAVVGAEDLRSAVAAARWADRAKP